MTNAIWLLAWVVWLSFIVILMIQFSMWFWLLVFVGPSIERVDKSNRKGGE